MARGSLHGMHFPESPLAVIADTALFVQELASLSASAKSCFVNNRQPRCYSTGLQHRARSSRNLPLTGAHGLYLAPHARREAQPLAQVAHQILPSYMLHICASCFTVYVSRIQQAGLHVDTQGYFSLHCYHGKMYDRREVMACSNVCTCKMMGQSAWPRLLKVDDGEAQGGDIGGPGVDGRGRWGISHVKAR